jgi:hypothetical protein
LEVSLQQDEQYPNNDVKGCILPWMHIFGGLNGNYHLCCHAQFQADSTIVGTYDQSLSDIWNSDHYKDTHLNFLKNKIPIECIKACYEKEKQGSDSNRLQVNRRFAKDTAITFNILPNLASDFFSNNVCNSSSVRGISLIKSSIIFVSSCTSIIKVLYVFILETPLLILGCFNSIILVMSDLSGIEINI